MEWGAGATPLSAEFWLLKETTFVTSCLFPKLTQPSQKGGYLLLGEQSLFRQELTPEIGVKNDRKRVASPESVPIYFNLLFLGGRSGSVRERTRNEKIMN